MRVNVNKTEVMISGERQNFRGSTTPLSELQGVSRPSCAGAHGLNTV